MSIYIITFICLVLQGIRGIPDFFHLRRLLKSINIQEKFLSKGSESNLKWFIFLPMYKEQKIVKETISYFINNFKNKNVYIVLIASSKEKSDQTTIDIVKEELRKNSWLDDGTRIITLIENNENSTMATQLNFAAKKIIDLGLASESNFFALYNADSRPSSYSINYFENIINQKSNCSDIVIQQPCAFIKDAGLNFGSFVDALSMYQTWFCMGHENRILKKYSDWIKIANKKRAFLDELFFSPLGYSVGHGSSMKLGTLIKEGGYPEVFLTEDLTFGYFLSAHKVPIFLADVLEVADVPSDFLIFIKQRSVWFWNYIEYFSCFFDKRVSDVKFVRRLSLLIQGFCAGAYWFISSIIYGLPVVLGIINHNLMVLIVGIAGIIFFQVVPIFYLIKKLPVCLEKNKLQPYADQIRKVSIFRILLSIFLIVLTDSIGPWIATVKALWYLPQGKRPRKYKTER